MLERGISSSSNTFNEDGVDLSVMTAGSTTFTKKTTTTATTEVTASSTEFSIADSISEGGHERRVNRAIQERKERMERALNHMHRQQKKRGDSSDISIVLEEARQALDRRRRSKSRSQSRSKVSDNSQRSRSHSRSKVSDNSQRSTSQSRSKVSESSRSLSQSEVRKNTVLSGSQFRSEVSGNIGKGDCSRSSARFRCPTSKRNISIVLEEARQALDRSTLRSRSRSQSRSKVSDNSQRSRSNSRSKVGEGSRSQSRSKVSDSIRPSGSLFQSKVSGNTSRGGCSRSTSRLRCPSSNSSSAPSDFVSTLTCDTTKASTTVSKNLARIGERLGKVKALLEQVERGESVPTSRSVNDTSTKASSTLHKAKTLLKDMEQQERAKTRGACTIAVRGRTITMSPPASSRQSSLPPSSRGQRRRPHPDLEQSIVVYDANRPRSRSQPRPSHHKQQQLRDVLPQHRPQRRISARSRSRSPQVHSTPPQQKQQQQCDVQQHQSKRRRSARSRSPRDVYPRKSSRSKSVRSSNRSQCECESQRSSSRPDGSKQQRRQRSRSSKRFSTSTREENHRPCLDTDLKESQYPVTKEEGRKSIGAKPSSSKKNGSYCCKTRSKTVNMTISNSETTILEASASLALRSPSREKNLDQRQRVRIQNVGITSPESRRAHSSDEKANLRPKAKEPRVTRSESPHCRSRAVVSDDEECSEDDKDDNISVNSIGKPTTGRTQDRRALYPVDMSRVETVLKKIKSREDSRSLQQNSGHEMKQSSAGHQQPYHRIPPPPPPREHRHPSSGQVLPFNADHHFPSPVAQGPPKNEWMKYAVKSSKKIEAAIDEKNDQRMSKIPGNVPGKFDTTARQALTVVKDMPFTDPMGDSGLYHGQVNEDGHPEGKGSMKYNNGIFYEGLWKNGCQDEKAALQYDRIRSGFTSWKGKGKAFSKSGMTMPWNAIKIDKNDENEKTNVRGMEWIDFCGDIGRYTGEVNRDEVPHGRGIMKYDYGLIVEGDWINGVLKENRYDPRMVAAAPSNAFMSSAGSLALSVGPRSLFPRDSYSLIGANGVLNENPHDRMVAMTPSSGPGSHFALDYVARNTAPGPVCGGMMPPMMIQPQQMMNPMITMTPPQHIDRRLLTPIDYSPAPLVNNDECSMEMRPPAPVRYF